ncbi:MAG: SRPBCC family protein [Nocardioidaceae bacterium]
MSTDVSTVVDINADPQAVWNVLTDFAAYGEWNPFMDRAEGTPEVGAKLVIHLAPPGGRGMTFKPTVTAATPGQELRWLGKLAFGGLFDGEHYFVLTPTANGATRLTHGERFSGILVALMKGTTQNAHVGYEAFNQALKQHVEGASIP